VLVSSPSDFSPPRLLGPGGVVVGGVGRGDLGPRSSRRRAGRAAGWAGCGSVGGGAVPVPGCGRRGRVRGPAFGGPVGGGPVGGGGARDSWAGFAERERTAGALQLFLRGLVVADDPVARRRPIGAPGPPNKPDAGEKGLLCHPGGWGGAESGGGVVAVPGSRPHPGHPPARPGSGPIPGTAVAVAVLVVVAASAVGLVGLRAGGRREGTSGRMQLLVRSPGRCGRPPSLGSWAPRAPMMRESGHRGLGLANGRDRREAASAFDVGELPRIHPEEGRDFILQGLRKCATLSGSRGPRITQGCAPR